MVKNAVPTYCIQRRKDKPDLAYVEWSRGNRTYLGEYGSVESRQKYARLIAEHAAVGQPVEQIQTPDLTVAELAAAYWRHAESYYTKNGRPTGEQEWIRLSLRPLVRLYGDTLAREFGPLKLKAVRDEIVKSGRVRTSVNQRIAKIRRVFKWAVSNEMLPPSVHEGLRTVDGLRRGRGGAAESKRVKPAQADAIDGALPYMRPPVRAMVELQRVTGMRSGEVRIMRACDIDMSRPVWIYEPTEDKLEHLEIPCKIALGPTAQKIITPLLTGDAAAYLFPTTTDGPPYTKDAYNKALRRACKRAGVERFTPTQVRHTAGTHMRRHEDLDAAQVLLRHRNQETTERYADVDEDMQEAIRLAAVYG